MPAAATIPYVFFDLVMAGIGVCRIADIALSVLTTVIGHQRASGRVIVGAGATKLRIPNGPMRKPIAVKIVIALRP